MQGIKSVRATLPQKFCPAATTKFSGAGMGALESAYKKDPAICHQIVKATTNLMSLEGPGGTDKTDICRAGDPCCLTITNHQIPNER